MASMTNVLLVPVKLDSAALSQAMEQLGKRVAANTRKIDEAARELAAPLRDAAQTIANVTAAARDFANASESLKKIYDDVNAIRNMVDKLAKPAEVPAASQAELPVPPQKTLLETLTGSWEESLKAILINVISAVIVGGLGFLLVGLKGVGQLFMSLKGLQLFKGWNEIGQRFKNWKGPGQFFSNLKNFFSKNVDKKNGDKTNKTALLAMLAAAGLAFASSPSKAHASTNAPGQGDILPADVAGGLSSTLDNDTQSASAFLETIGAILNVLVTFGPLLATAAGALGGLGGALGTVAAFAAPMLPLLAALAGIALAAGLIIANWEGISDFFSGVFDSISATVSGWVDTVLGLLPDWLKHLLGIGGDGAGLDVSAAASEAVDAALAFGKGVVDGISEAVSGAGDAVKNFGSGFLDQASGFFGSVFSGDASDGVSPALAGGFADYSSDTTINGGVNVYTQATDAQGIAKELPGAVKRHMTVAGNKAVQQ